MVDPMHNAVRNVSPHMPAAVEAGSGAGQQQSVRSVGWQQQQQRRRPSSAQQPSAQGMALLGLRCRAWV
jgi:hypothetical protein